MIVARDAVNRSLLSSLVDGLPDDPEMIEQHTGCWNRLELDGGRWKAVTLNSTPTAERAPASVQAIRTPRTDRHA